MGQGRSEMEASGNRMKLAGWIFGGVIGALLVLTFFESIDRHDACNKKNGILINSNGSTVCVTKDIILE